MVLVVWKCRKSMCGSGGRGLVDVESELVIDFEPCRGQAEKQILDQFCPEKLTHLSPSSSWP